MKNEKGYTNIMFGALFFGLFLAGVIVGGILFFAVPWVWSFLKPFIHALTT